MNTLAHLTAIAVSMWLAVYGFWTLSINALGIAGLGLTFMWLVLLYFAIQDDITVFIGRKVKKQLDEA